MVWLVSLLLEGHTFQVKGKGIKGREQKQFSVSSMISHILVEKTGNRDRRRMHAKKDRKIKRNFISMTSSVNDSINERKVTKGYDEHQQ